jgi:hypothetical protein
MSIDYIRKAVLPPGPVLVLTLVGIMLLSSLLYYRAVRIQRFLEPALAVSQPRIKFYNDISRLLIKEFGEGEVKGIKFVGNSILLHKSMILLDPYHLDKSPLLKSLGVVILDVLRDPNMRAHLDFIVVSPRVALSSDIEANRAARTEAQSSAEMILNALFKSVPELERDYSIYFESSAMSVYARGDEADWVDFRIVPSDRVHVDVLQRLQKYVE